MKFEFVSILIILATLFIRCEIETVDYEQPESPYRSEHFIIYYNTDMIMPEKMEKIALRKERLYNHINNYLQTDFNGTIETFVVHNRGTSVKYLKQQTFETYDNIIEDSGLQIAHIISLRQWGYSPSRFFRHGIATACEIRYKSDETVIDLFKEQLERALKKISMDSVMVQMKMDVIDSTDYTFNFIRAGAFLHYLRSTYGILSLKWIYQTTLVVDEKLYEQKFKEIFNRSLDTLISDFLHYVVQH